MSDLSVIETFDGHPRKAGCLPRKSKPGEWCPMASDRIEIIPEGQWEEISQEVQLNGRVLKVLDQNGYGSCASEASTQSVMIAREVAGYPFELLNPLSVYGRVNGGRDAGSSIDTNLQFIKENGIVPMRLWPRSVGWRRNPTDEKWAWAEAQNYRIEEYWDIASIDEFVSALLRGFPVVWGARGHALCAVAYKSGYPEVVNSWSESWKNRGFGEWVSWRGIQWGYGAWSPRVASPSGGEVPTVAGALAG